MALAAREALAVWLATEVWVGPAARVVWAARARPAKPGRPGGARQVVMRGQEDWAVKAALVGLVVAQAALAAPGDGAGREATVAPARIVSKACLLAPAGRVVTAEAAVKAASAASGEKPWGQEVPALAARVVSAV